MPPRLSLFRFSLKNFFYMIIRELYIQIEMKYSFEFSALFLSYQTKQMISLQKYISL